MRDSINVIQQFKSAIQSVGLRPPETIIPGKFQRFPGAGKKQGNTAGWCKLYDDLGGGVYGDFSTDLDAHWQPERQRPYSAEERAEFMRKVEVDRMKREEDRKAQHSVAIQWAKEILDAATDDPTQHPYALKKRVPLGALVKRGPWHQRGWQDALLFACYDADQHLSTIEATNVNGDKDSLAGGIKSGAIFPLKPFKAGKAGIVVIAEGVATAAAAAESISASAVAALGKFNLKHSAEIVRKLNQDAKIIIIADHDPSGEGLKAAKQAALAVGGLVVDLAEAIPGEKFDAWDVFDQIGQDGLGRIILRDAKQAEDIECVDGQNVRLASAEQSHPARDEARRQLQKDENSRIQNCGSINTLAPILSVNDMVKNYVWINSGEQVAHTADRHFCLSFKEFKSYTAASVTTEEPETPKAKPKTTLNALIWQRDQNRMTVETRTFCAGSPVICHDPDGRSAVNMWRPIQRIEGKADISPFLGHVDYLFTDKTERETFLDWLAHLEQKPGELPHYGWLHIADNTGTGRNWLASVLARVWRGYVAPNVDLPALLDSQFNGQLAGRLLAIVDEVQEAAGENPYRHTNKLKSLVNAEYRDINPKFGRQYREHNACRWLVFSNHNNALPLNDTDRRWRVVKHSAAPRGQRDYAELYGLLSDQRFIDSIGTFLAARDISRFNPGERPPINVAKRIAVDASKSMVQRYAENLVARWPRDIVTNADAAEVMSDGSSTAITLAMRRALDELGCISIDGPVKIRGKAYRCWVLRNHEKWVDALPREFAAEVEALRSTPNQAAIDVLANSSYSE